MINRVKTKGSGKNKITTTINGVTTVVESKGFGYHNVKNNSYKIGKRDVVTSYNNKESYKWKAFDKRYPDKIFYGWFELTAIIKLLRSK